MELAFWRVELVVVCLAVPGEVRDLRFFDELGLNGAEFDEERLVVGDRRLEA